MHLYFSYFYWFWIYRLYYFMLFLVLAWVVSLRLGSISQARTSSSLETFFIISSTSLLIILISVGLSDASMLGNDSGTVLFAVYISAVSIFIMTTVFGSNLVTTDVESAMLGNQMLLGWAWRITRFGLGSMLIITEAATSGLLLFCIAFT